MIVPKMKTILPRTNVAKRLERALPIPALISKEHMTTTNVWVGYPINFLKSWINTTSIKIKPNPRAEK